MHVSGFKVRPGFRKKHPCLLGCHRRPRCWKPVPGRGCACTCAWHRPQILERLHTTCCLSLPSGAHLIARPRCGCTRTSTSRWRTPWQSATGSSHRCSPRTRATLAGGTPRTLLATVWTPSWGGGATWSRRRFRGCGRPTSPAGCTHCVSSRSTWPISTSSKPPPPPSPRVRPAGPQLLDSQGHCWYCLHWRQCPGGGVRAGGFNLRPVLATTSRAGHRREHHGASFVSVPNPHTVPTTTRFQFCFLWEIACDFQGEAYTGMDNGEQDGR